MPTMSNTECHICHTHKKDKFGYPRCNRNGFRLLHRWVYFQKTGEEPEVVMHTCDNPACINPDHLRAGTQLENIQDRVKKSRSQSKLSEKEKLIVREMIFKGNSERNVSRKLGVSRAVIHLIKEKMEVEV